MNGSGPITFASTEDLQAAVTRAIQAATPAPAPVAAAPAMVLPAAAHPSGGWPANVQPGPWGAPPVPMMPAGAMPGAAPQPAGLAVKLTVPLPDGNEMPIDLHFGAEYATPQGIVALAGALIAAGFPIKTYRPRNNGWGDRSGGFSRGGGYGGGNNYGGGGGGNYGGGYRRGGWGR